MIHRVPYIIALLRLEAVYDAQNVRVDAAPEKDNDQQNLWPICFRCLKIPIILIRAHDGQICQNNFYPSRPAFQGHWNRHGSISYLWLYKCFSPTMALSLTVSAIKSDICKVSSPLVFNVSGGFHLELYNGSGTQKKIEFCPYQGIRVSFNNMFLSLDTVPALDRQTTVRIAITISHTACITSWCAKNILKKYFES